METFVSKWPKALDDLLTSSAPQQLNTKSGQIGQKLIDVLLLIYDRPITTKSDDARLHADYIAMAACMGLITTKITGDVFGREWRVTAHGLTLIEVFEG